MKVKQKTGYANKEIAAGLALAIFLCLMGNVAHAAEPVLEFTGNGSYIDLGTPEALHMAEDAPFTIEGWVKLNRFSDRDMLYSRRASRDSGNYTYMFGTIDGDKMSAYIGHGGSPNTEWRDVALVPTLETGRWYHLAFSFDGEDLVYYLDGVAVGTNDFRYSDHANYQVMIGGYSDGSDIDGYKSDVRVWDHARDQEQIQDYMHYRLGGNEAGLLGYWPLNEGEGTTVYDGTYDGTEGTVINAEWVVDGDLALVLPFILADQETGSTRFTNSNEVDIVVFPMLDGYDQFQITESGETNALEAWTATSAVPAGIKFTQPSGDTNITLYVWFTNSTDEVTLRRREGNIFYTEVLPVPLVRETVTIERLPEQNVEIHLGHIDIGSTGGDANDREVAFFARKLLCAEVPSCDLTPDDPFVTVDSEGDYSIVLWLQNEAGNTAVSATTSTVSVIAYSGTNVWTGAGATDLWHDPANWSAGVPQTGQDVRIDSAPNARLTNATAALASFRITSGRTLTVEGWQSAIDATEMTIEGTITHAAQTVTEPDPQTGEWVPQHRIWLKGDNIEVTTGGRLQANFLGYPRGAGPGTVSHNAGAGHAGNGGRGGSQYAWAGSPYGDPANPWQPGSGGGGSSANSRPGGGAIRIEATGHVTVDGEITAHGQSGAATHGSGGSGGSILINAHTIHGEGLIGARGGGGDRHGGAGSAGRIAVHYDAQTQAALGVPPALRFNGGTGSPGSGSTGHRPASIASLYLPDTLWITETLEGGRFQHVRLEIPDWDHWAPSQLTLEDCTIGLPVGFHLQVVGDLRLRENAGLHVYPPPVSDPLTEPGALVEIGGNFEVGPDCWVYPWGDMTNGATVVFSVDGGVIVDETGGFNADGLGYDRRHGPGEPGNNRGGGGYGGKGGDYQEKLGGDPYGDPDVPVELGSGGDDGEGGGAIRVLVGGNADIRGLLTANGGRGRVTHGSAGSGGTIFVSAGGRVTGNGTLQANGLNGDRQGAAGGGGRIAVWYRAPLSVAWEMMTAQAVDHMHPLEHPDLTFEVETGTNHPGDPGSVRYNIYAVPGTMIWIR